MIKDIERLNLELTWLNKEIEKLDKHLLMLLRKLRECYENERRVIVLGVEGLQKRIKALEKQVSISASEKRVCFAQIQTIKILLNDVNKNE